MRIDAVDSAASVIQRRCGEGGGADVLVDGIEQLLKREDQVARRLKTLF